MTKCICDGPAEFGDKRHEPHCPCAPKLDNGWAWYPHDGELENGGVFAHLTDPRRIYLLVRGCLVPVERRDGDWPLDVIVDDDGPKAT
jgi:hypothetical protein